MQRVYVINKKRIGHGIEIVSICSTLELALEYMKENPLDDYDEYTNDSPIEMEVIQQVATDKDHMWYGYIDRDGEANISRGNDEDIVKECFEVIMPVNGKLLLNMGFVAKTRADAERVITDRRDELVRKGEWVYREE